MVNCCILRFLQQLHHILPLLEHLLTARWLNLKYQINYLLYSLFRLHKPLRQVLRVWRLCPLVCVYVEHVLLLRCLFLCWLLFALCSLYFRLLGCLWSLQGDLLFMRVQLLRLVNRQVPYRADVLLNPVQILTHQFFLLLMVVTQYHIFIRYFLDLLQVLPQRCHMQIYQRQVVPQRHILERQAVVSLHQKHILLKQLMNQLLWLNQCSVVIQCVDFTHISTAYNFVHPCIDLGLALVSLC